MKKINKFRAWLIRKLGGEIPVLIKPVIIERQLPTVTLSSRMSFTQDEVQWLRYMFQGGETEVKKRLWNGFMEKAIPLMSVACKENEELNIVECEARLTIVKELQNG